jgi:DNA-binding transcriptional LysR family regulator
MDVRGLDLNLLIPLRVLLTERHVTRAAERLGITQPAMSASLARLRALFDDQLLVRGPKGLAPTVRGQQLLNQLDQVIGVIEQLVADPKEFVPGTSRRTFTLIGTDFIETLLLPSLMADLAVEAPGVQVVFRPPDPKNLEALMSEGEVDLAVGYLPDAPKGLITSVAFHDRFACIARRNHPQLSADQFPLDQFVDLKHVQVLPRDLPMYGMPIDAARLPRSPQSRGTSNKAAARQDPNKLARTDLLIRTLILFSCNDAARLTLVRSRVAASSRVFPLPRTPR